MKILFVLEGYTDIRFVSGLSEICDLSIVTPTRQFRESGLGQRILERGIRVQIDELPGGRLRYQGECLRYLWKRARDFDVILSQEVLRGTLNSCLAGVVKKVPVVTYMCMPPVQYYRCRRERGQNNWVNAIAGETIIRVLMTVNGRLATRCVALGPYLVEIASAYCRRTEPGFYYGVDTDFYRPAESSELPALRSKLGLPAGKFLVFSGSRISHEKDPETVLHAVALCRARGLDAAVINLGGGHQKFLELARQLSLRESEQWVLGRPAAHPMIELADYYRSADAVAQASLAEGAGMVPLEALSCAVPVVCTAVGGLARILPGYARLTPKRDPQAMAEQLLWIADHRDEARAQALAGREFVIREWGRQKAFASLRRVLEESAFSSTAAAATRAAL
jgi:glycosyltransferase involved in cell wall biosynthesis